MRALVVALALAFLLLSADRAAVTAGSSPSDPQQQLAIIAQVRAQLGSNLADALAAQQQLQQSLQANAAQQAQVQRQISDVNARIADLEQQIADAQRREAMLAHRIETERAQLRQLARAVYESPGSVLVVLAQSRSLSDLFTRVADLNVAGSRAAEIKTSLARDLEALQVERRKEQAARDEQVIQRNQLSTELSQLRSLQAQQETTLAMLDAHGSRGLLGSGDGAKAGYRGQIGRRSAWAHAVAHNIRFEPGDVLVTETGAPVWGYQAELERSMVVGPPTDRMRFLFDHMLASQQVAFDAFRPGATCADVDVAVLRYFDEHGLRRYWRQHTGHGTGLRNHEAPFLDVGDPTPLEPGMVFTIEPGLYDDEVGGFRHSDTVAVTEDGYELLTDYPSDLESLTIRA